MSWVSMLSSRRVVGIVVAVGLLLQILLAFALRSPWLTNDSTVYIELANGLSQGSYGRAVDGYAPDVLRPPGYPILLFLVSTVGLAWAAVVLVQLFLAALSVWLVWKVAERWEIPPAIFAFLALSYPFAIFYCAVIGVEGILVPIFATMAALVAAPSPRLWHWALTGALAGFAILLRSDMMLLPVLLAGFAVVLPKQRVSLRERFVPAAIAGFAAVLIVLPYMVWNHHHFDRWQPSPRAAAVGSSLYIAVLQHKLSHEDITALYHGRSTPATEKAGIEAEIQAVNSRIGAPPKTPPFNPAEYPTQELQIEANLAFGAVAMDHIMADPWAHARFIAANIWWLWNTQEYPTQNRLIVAVLTVAAGAITILGYLGIVLALAAFQRDPARTRVALLALYPLAVHLPLHLEARYTAASRLLLVLFAALAVFEVLARFHPHLVGRSE